MPRLTMQQRSSETASVLLVRGPLGQSAVQDDPQVVHGGDDDHRNDERDRQRLDALRGLLHPPRKSACHRQRVLDHRRRCGPP
jgi:hypothetical protein